MDNPYPPVQHNVGPLPWASGGNNTSNNPVNNHLIVGRFTRDLLHQIEGCNVRSLDDTAHRYRTLPNPKTGKTILYMSIVTFM